MKDELRIGVFACDCGGEISDALAVDKIMQKISRLPDVVHLESFPYGCSPDGEEIIQKRIQSESLNRVVLLGCSPRIMEKRFRNVCAEAGLNPSLLEIVNIRDGCVRGQYDDPGFIENKAWDLTRLGIVRACHLTPIVPVRVEIHPEVAVIGGGITGMTAALALAEQGIGVKLVEKARDLGTTAWKRTPAFPSLESGTETAEKLAKRVQMSQNIEVLTGAEPVAVSGSYGRYEIELKLVQGRTGEGTEKIKAGAILLAVGGQELKPKGYYGYGENTKVITQGELEEKLSDNPDLSDIENVVTIQCVGARNTARPYCGRICCMTAVYNAILLKKKKPSIDVTILYRDIPAEPGPDRNMLDEARELGIRFRRFAEETPPAVTASAVLGESQKGVPFELPYDLVVLSTPPVPHGSSKALADIFRIPVDEFGFFQDTSPRLKPHQHTEPCIHTAGSAHWPCSVSEAMYQAYGKSARIASLVQRREFFSTRASATVSVGACRGCATCLEWCPFDVPVMQNGSGDVPVSFIDPFLCKGCGSCVVHCPTGAVTIENLEDKLLYSMVEAALPNQSGSERKTIAFLCDWSGYAAADLASTKHRNLPAEVIPIRIPCAGRISTGLILHAFALGANGVLVCACEDGGCHYLSGNTNCAAVTSDTADLLSLLGIEKSRFQMVRVNAVDVEGFCQTLGNFVSEITKPEPRTTSEIHTEAN